MPPILYLIDGHALAYRTYFALTTTSGDRFKTHSGEPTAGIYGFASVLLSMLEKDRPEYLAVAFDTGKTFRDELFPDYKATREKMPDDLRSQMDRIRQMVDAFHIPRLEAKGFEADDVLGSIARQAVEKGLGVKILTGDRDLLQLVGDRVIVRLAGSKLSEAPDCTVKEVLGIFGVPPEKVIEYKALVGDASDNIPGVHGVGEKTTLKLLEQFNNLEEIYANLDKVPVSVRSKLEAGREMAFLSRNLATIRTDVKIVLDLEQAKTEHLDFAGLEKLFVELEFRTLIARLHTMQNKAPVFGVGPQLALFGQEVTQVGTPSEYELNVVVVDTPARLAELKTRLESSAKISFDTETTSTDAMRADLVGISLAVQPGEGYYIPVMHRSGQQLPVGEVIEALRPAMTDERIPKIGQNLKYDATMLSRNGLQVSPLSFDCMLAEWVEDPNSHNLGLKDMAEIYLHARMTHIEELIGKGKAQISMADVSIAQAAPYAAADAEVCLKLEPLLRKRLVESQTLALFEKIEMPLVPVLCEMEQNGIMLDVPFFETMSRDLSERMEELTRQIYDGVGYSFNINSTQQLSKVLFDTLGLRPPGDGRKTASGHFSTSADVLEELRGQHPTVDWVLEYRELAKIKSTYVDALPLQINPRTGRVHTSYNQTGSVTGRLASTDPNLQNIPIRTEAGRRVRQGFVASPGMVLLSVDYSQIELRIVAHMAGDEAMLNAFRAGQDIHATTAAAVYGIPLEEVTKEQRRQAKAINFGLIYGMSAFGLSRQTGQTLGEAEDFVKAYFQKFPGVKGYLDGIRKLAARQGYVETLMGRKRYFPNLKSNAVPALRAREEREAINAPIQGTAADILKMAMIALPAELKKEKLSARILLQVHDELVLECVSEELKKTARAVCRIMENACTLSIPLTTEARWGDHWGSLQVIYDFND